jgi:hypothetical protein
MWHRRHRRQRLRRHGRRRTEELPQHVRRVTRCTARVAAALRVAYFLLRPTALALARTRRLAFRADGRGCLQLRCLLRRVLSVWRRPGPRRREQGRRSAKDAYADGDRRVRAVCCGRLRGVAHARTAETEAHGVRVRFPANACALDVAGPLCGAQTEFQLMAAMETKDRTRI